MTLPILRERRSRHTATNCRPPHRLAPSGVTALRCTWQRSTRASALFQPESYSDQQFPGKFQGGSLEDDFLFAFEPAEVVGATFLSGVARRHFLAWHRIGGGEAALEHG